MQVQVWERHGVCRDAAPHDTRHQSWHQGLQQLAVMQIQPQIRAGECRAADQSHTFTAAWLLTEETSRLQVIKGRPLQHGCYRSDKTEKKRGIGQTKYRDPAQERLLRSTNTHGLFSVKPAPGEVNHISAKTSILQLYLKWKCEAYLLNDDSCIYWKMYLQLSSVVRSSFVNLHFSAQTIYWTELIKINKLTHFTAARLQDIFIRIILNSWRLCLM